jgi:selenide,water dikinase
MTAPVALTQYTKGGGCACKIGPKDLAQILGRLPPVTNPDVLVGVATSDDACAYRIDAERALVQTLDFFTPVVNDPYDFGQIAAANAISDVYAMGGRPLFALSIVGFPTKTLPLEILGQILAGGSDKAREAGIDIIGGHSIDDPEPKYGLAVTGIVDQRRILTNAAAQEGDLLVLTKPLGAGILTTGIKRGVVSDEAAQRVIAIMKTLNRAAAECLPELAVHSLTDVTGFGLLGHLREMVAGSGISAKLNFHHVPVLDDVWPLVQQGVYPGGAARNLEAVADWVHWPSSLGDNEKRVLADPQTSGGLLIAVAPADAPALVQRLQAAGTWCAAVIGEFTRTPQLGIYVEHHV